MKDGRSREASAPEPSRRVLQACALFGISPDLRVRRRCAAARARYGARRLLRLPAGQIAFVTGPSGAGKSLMLCQVAEVAPASVPIFGASPADGARWRRGRVIDQFRGPLGEALGALSRAGLADATLLAAEPGHLSEGQRFRVQLALAMHGAERAGAGFRPLILVDEFGSTLDRTTARNIARMLRRWVCTTHVRVVCASAIDDILEALAPDVLVYQPLEAMPVIAAKATGNGGATRAQRRRGAF